MTAVLSPGYISKEMYLTFFVAGLPGGVDKTTNIKFEMQDANLKNLYSVTPIPVRVVFKEKTATQMS